MVSPGFQHLVAQDEPGNGGTSSVAGGGSAIIDRHLVAPSNKDAPKQSGRAKTVNLLILAHKRLIRNNSGKTLHAPNYRRWPPDSARG